MAEMTDATNIANVSSLTHYSEPYAHFLLLLGIRLCTTSKVRWSYSEIYSSLQLHICFDPIFIRLARSLEAFLHDLPKDSPICSAIVRFSKNILIFYHAPFQLPFLLSPGSSLSCFLRKHSRHQSPYTDYLTLRRNLLPKTPSHHPSQTHPIQCKMSTMIVSKPKNLYLFVLY